MFDSSLNSSVFYQFVAREFRRLSTVDRKCLTDKEYAGLYVNKLGISTARRHSIFRDIQTLTSEDLGDSAVLKYGLGWSGQGVMLLERIDDGVWFDHMTLTKRLLKDIISAQENISSKFGHENKYWIIEEFLESVYSVGRIPFDYKFYMFRDRVGLIIQIDRNSSPPKVSVFSDGFVPLRLNRDYVFNGSNDMQPSTPLIPLHANEMLFLARKLSTSTDSPFVSIDLYDCPSGPVFGEFTFSPGAVNNELLIYSVGIVAQLDKLFMEGKNALESGVLSVGDSVGDVVSGINAMPKEYIDLQSFRILTAHVYNKGSRGALRLADLFWDREKNAHDLMHKKCFRLLKIGWALIREQIIENRNVNTI